MSKYTTKDEIEVRPGQIWRDRDKRTNGRLIRVLRTQGGFAVCQPCAENGRTHGRKTRILPRRMHAHSTGFDLVKSIATSPPFATDAAQKPKP
jgi:hypothetical protein